MFITADKIHDGKKFLASGTAIELSDDGVVKSIAGHYAGEATFYEGIICPGFVNTHCHLELSHLKGFIPKHTGLIPFLLQVIKGRGDFSEIDKTYSRVQAYEMMWQNGIAALGDIANTTDALDIRSLERMYIHTFVEAIGFNEAVAARSFEYALKTYDSYRRQGQASPCNKQSITPHAPYSVSKKLFGLISDFEEQSIISIHNQESAEEDKFYKDKTGAVNDLLKGLGIDAASFEPSGISSMQTYTQWLGSAHPIIFVHDSFTAKEDVEAAMQRFPKAYFCLCPNANLYIENTLPDVHMFMEAGATVCIGTDSLASNDKLCIYSELQTLHRQFNIEWERLLQWACYNGALALQMDEVAGSFEPGKRPGVVNIHNDIVHRIL